MKVRLKGHSLCFLVCLANDVSSKIKKALQTQAIFENSWLLLLCMFEKDSWKVALPCAGSCVTFIRNNVFILECVLLQCGGMGAAAQRCHLLERA